MLKELKFYFKYLLLKKYGIQFQNTNYRTISLGSDWRYDLCYYCHPSEIQTIFDVGANIGQTVNQVIKIFPSSKIYCFEPIPSTFKALQENINKITNVQCFELALGDISGEAQITCNPLSGQNTFIVESKTSESTISVQVSTVDKFCEYHNIQSLNILKIDTEGFECQVLSGAYNMLSSQKIGFVLAECDFGRREDNDPHGNFFDIFNYLKPLGYDIVAFYPDGLDSHGWRWGNVLFKASRVMPSNKLIRHHKLRDIINLSPFC